MPEAQLAATGTWGAGRRRGARAPRRAAMNFTLALADSGALLERLGMGKRRARRQGLAHRRGLVAGLAAVARLRQDDRPGQGGDRLRPVPEGRARARRACSACSACSRCRAGCCSTSATCSQEGFAFDNVTGDVKIGAGRGDDQQPAHARRGGGGADGRQRRPRARDAGPARRRRPRDQRRHRVARLRGHQPGDRPRHLPRPVLPAQAADRRPSTREFRVTGPWDDPKVERVERSLLGDARRRPTPPAAEPRADAVTR